VDPLRYLSRIPLILPSFYLTPVPGVSNPEAEAIASVKLANLDSGFLGHAYSEDSIVVEYDADHFELLDPQLLKKYTDPILQRLQVAATKRSNEGHS
jgi:hypothetical protein